MQPPGIIDERIPCGSQPEITTQAAIEQGCADLLRQFADRGTDGLGCAIDPGGCLLKGTFFGDRYQHLQFHQLHKKRPLCLQPTAPDIKRASRFPQPGSVAGASKRTLLSAAIRSSARRSAAT